MDSYHLTHDGGQWKLRKQGDPRPVLHMNGTQEEAVRECVRHVQRHSGSLRIHRLDGSFEEERAFPGTNDSSESPG